MGGIQSELGLARSIGTWASQLSRAAAGCALSLWLGACLAANVPGDKDAVLIALPAPVLNGMVSLEKALANRRSRRNFTAKTLALSEVAQLLWAAQGTTSAQGRRTAPSAGARYPLELYLVAGNVNGLVPGIYHYVSQPHRLERLSSGDRREALAEAAVGQRWLAAAPAIVVVGAVPLRTFAKYGARAERYVHLEAGHAAQNVLLQSVALGLGATVVGAFDDEDASELIGLPLGAMPLCLIAVGHYE